MTDAERWKILQECGTAVCIGWCDNGEPVFDSKVQGLHHHGTWPMDAPELVFRDDGTPEIRIRRKGSFFTQACAAAPIWRRFFVEAEQKFSMCPDDHFVTETGTLPKGGAAAHTNR